MASPVVLTPIGAVTLTITRAKAKKFFDLYNILASLTEQDLKAISVLGLIYTIKSNGAFGPGTDYSANHTGLISDAQIFTNGLGQFNRTIGAAAAEWSNGRGIDNTLSTDGAALLKEARDLRQLPAEQLDRIRTYLRILLTI